MGKNHGWGTVAYAARPGAKAAESPSTHSKPWRWEAEPDLKGSTQPYAARAGLRRASQTKMIGLPADPDAFRELVKAKAGMRRGETLASSGQHFTILLEGLACMATRHEDGARQIYAFYYPGDFLALHGFLNPESTDIEVQALSNCSIGTIDRDIFEETIQRRPELGQALWRAAMLEAGIFRLSQHPAKGDR